MEEQEKNEKKEIKETKETKKEKMTLESTLLLSIGFTSLGIIIIGFINWMLSFF